MNHHHIHRHHHHFFTSSAPQPPPPHLLLHQFTTDAPRRHRLSFSIRAAALDSHTKSEECGSSQTTGGTKRRQFFIAPILTLGASVLQSAVSRADEIIPLPPSPSPPTPPPLPSLSPPPEVQPSPPAEAAKNAEELMPINSRIYDATAIGEPLALGKEKSAKALERLTNARIVYLGEAEQVPTLDDKSLELEIVKSLRTRCVDSQRLISLAMQAFHCELQPMLDDYLDKRIDEEAFKALLWNWPPERWQEYEPLLSYCRDNGVRIVACGVPPKVLRTVQAEGLQGLSKPDRKLYTPPAGSGFSSGFTYISRRLNDLSTENLSIASGPSSYLTAQARVVEDYSMSRIILQAVADGGASGLLVVITGASHVTYGSRGTGVPARISKKMQKRNQVVVLLNPERQLIRREGEVPVSDFLWYSAAKPCNRNCFDRAEIARVMNAAGRRKDALPQDLQKGLDQGLVSPEVLQNFFDLEQYPLIKELTDRFQGFRERLLADPKFLHRLAIEESISITANIVAQYEKRQENFFEELDYVITDTVRGIVVDFFTVWLPAPTITFLSYNDDSNSPDSMNALKGLLGSIPDNAFQKNLAGRDWNLSHRIASVLFGGLKLSGVGFVSSIAAVASSNAILSVRKLINPELVIDQRMKRPPILKTAVVYASFLGISANLRYQIIAGVIEHRISDEFASQTILVGMLSFIARTINSYWGTQQWIDLARFSGLQSSKNSEPVASEIVDPHPTNPIVGCQSTEEAGTSEIKN
ncbi:Protein RETICULATA-RELATED 6, chloroplastic [Linum grandiflorum]